MTNTYYETRMSLEAALIDAEQYRPDSEPEEEYTIYDKIRDEAIND